MRKVNSLSLCKRFMSLVASVMLMFSSIPGLAEDSEVEITSSTKVEDQMKGNPNELTKEEQQIQEVLSEDGKVQDELRQYTKDEFIAVRDIAKENIKELKKKSYVSQQEMNDMFYLLSFMRCKDIRDELIEDGIISEDFNECKKNALIALTEILNAASHNPKYEDDIVWVLIDEEDRERNTELLHRLVSLEKSSYKPTENTVIDVKKVLSMIYCDVDNPAKISKDDFENDPNLPLAFIIHIVLDSDLEFATRKPPAKYDPNHPVSQMIWIRRACVSVGEALAVCLNEVENELEASMENKIEMQ